MARHNNQRMVVIGGSVAGLAAAAALSPRSTEVLLLERRPLPPAGAPPVSIAPQGSFPHVLLAAGAAALDRLVPGFTDDLVAQGAVAGDGGDLPTHWWVSGAVRRSFPDPGVRAPLCSRALVETTLRTRVLALANVTAVEDVIVRGLRCGSGRVEGVELERNGTTERLAADAVVDASGRATRSPSWLEAQGYAPPPVSRVNVGITYTAVDVRRRAGDAGGALLVGAQNTPELARIGVALPAEGDRWKIVLGGYFGDAAPTNREGVLAFAASLGDPAILELLGNDWLSEPAQYRFPSSQRRHWEKARRLPAGFYAVGDAAASFNPLYGQGMSAAACQVEAMAAALDRHGLTARGARAAARGAAKVVANPWQIATGADFIYERTEGHKPAGTDLVNRYMARVLAAAAHDPVVNVALARVQQLLAPPPSLFAPRVVRRALRASRRPARVPSADVHVVGVEAGVQRAAVAE